MAQHNLSTVVAFEFLRTITKPRFWLGTLAVHLSLRRCRIAADGRNPDL